MTTMTVTVTFTVEIDPDAYRLAVDGDHYTDAEVAKYIGGAAEDDCRDWLRDTGVLIDSTPSPRCTRCGRTAREDDSCRDHVFGKHDWPVSI